MRVDEIMSTHMVATSGTQMAEHTWSEMRLKRVRHLVVMDRRKVVGILSARDLGGRHGATVRKGHTVAALMTHHVARTGPKATLRQAANLMRGRTIGFLPVVDDGCIVGIVTITDILERLGRGSTRPAMRAESRIRRSPPTGHHQLGGVARTRALGPRKRIQAR